MLKNAKKYGHQRRRRRRNDSLTQINREESCFLVQATLQFYWQWTTIRTRVTIEDILTIAIVLQSGIWKLRYYCDSVGTVAIVFP